MPVTLPLIVTTGVESLTMLTTTEAADVLGLDRRSVSSLCKRGVIAATKHGRDWMIRDTEVVRYGRERRPAHRPVKK